jgi:hypothetical protein
MTSKSHPPAPDEVEISLFGPGYGESVLLHLGEGDWIIVDSCVTRDGKTPAVLPYLQSIGVDPSIAVRLVIATHWHDDHVRGLARLYQTCNKARFVYSQALKKDEFFTLVFAVNEAASRRNSGVDEFYKILHGLKDEGKGPHWAISDRRLWQRNGSLPSEVWALSPSDEAVTMAFREIGTLLRNMGRQRGGPLLELPSPNRNHGAVALWVSIGNVSVLLGSDLEDFGSSGMGWATVLASQNRPAGRARVYKVAHHGAASDEYSGIWTTLLENRPVAMLTPFSLGSVNLPTSGDVDRLRNRTPNVFASARVETRRADFGAGAVGRMKKEVLRDYRKVEYSKGWVRVRINTRDTRYRADLFGDAVALGASQPGLIA